MSRTKTPIKSSSSSNAPERKAVYHGILIQESHRKYETLLEMIQFRENMHSVNFEYLTNKEECSEAGEACTISISYRLCSARDSIKDRLFCLVARLKKELKTGEITKKKLLITLEMTEHDYDLSYKNKPAVLKYRVLKMLPDLVDCMDNQGNLAYEKPDPDRSYMLLNLNSKLQPQALEKTETRALSVIAKKSIILSQEQETSLWIPLPGIISGNAGTGKTLVALFMHMHYILKHPEQSKDSLFVANTVFMKKEVERLWKKMWTDLREKPEDERPKDIPENAEERLSILTWKDLIAEYYAKKDQLDCEIVKKRLIFTRRDDLARWHASDEGPLNCSSYRNYKKLHGNIPEFQVLRKDLDKIQDTIMFLSGYSEAEFLALKGERECPWQGQTLREFLYRDILESFKKFCKKEQLEDERIFAMEQGYLSYALITVDESQNRSLQQLQSLLHCSADGSIAYFLDPKQQIQANHHLLQRLKKWLGAICPQGASDCTLNTCFRSSIQVINMMNKALQLRNQVCDSAKNEVTRVTAAPKALTGRISAVFNPDTKQGAILQKIANNPGSVVLVLDKTQVADAKAKYGTETPVFTLQQAVGVEFSTVIIHHPFDHPDFSKLNECLRKLQEGIPIEKGNSHAHLLPGFLYTLISRAEAEVIWVLPEKTRNRQYVIDSYGLEDLPSLEDKDLQSSKASMEEQILKYLIMGDWQIALQSFLKYGLGLTREDFKNFCKNKGMEDWDFPRESIASKASADPVSVPALPSEDFSKENMKKWLREKNGLFNPAMPEKSRFALILQDRSRIQDLQSCLSEDKQIEKLDPREFSRFFIYALDKNTFENTLEVQELMRYFLQNHPKSIPCLFEKFSASISPQALAKKSKKSRKNNSKIQNPVETKSLFSWLIEYKDSCSELGNIFRETSDKCLPWIGKKDFLNEHLLELSTSSFRHTFLSNIFYTLKKNLGATRFSEMLQTISVDTFSKCHLHLINSPEGLRVYSTVIRSNSILREKVTRAEIESGRNIGRAGLYTFKNIINAIEPGWTLQAISEKEKTPVKESAEDQKSFSYTEICHYMKDVLAFIASKLTRQRLFFSINFLGNNPYQPPFDFLLSRAEGHPHLLEIFEKHRELLEYLCVEDLKKRGMYRKELFLSEYWESFKKLLTENNESLNKAIQDFLNGDVLITPQEVISEEPEIQYEMGEMEPELSENRMKYVRNLLSDFKRDNVINLLNVGDSTLNSLLFTRIPLHASREKTSLLAEILKDDSKYTLFIHELPLGLKKLGYMHLSKFLTKLPSEGPGSENALDFLRIILEKYPAEHCDMLLTAPLSCLTNATLLKEIVRDSLKYAIYLQHVSQERVLKRLNIAQLQYLFIEYTDINQNPFRDFFGLILQKHPQKQDFLFSPFFTTGGESSVFMEICEDTEKCLTFFELLEEAGESISSYLFVDNFGRLSGWNIEPEEQSPPFLKKLVESNAGCMKLSATFLKLAENKFQFHPWYLEIERMFGKYSKINGEMFRNCCSSLHGQLLLKKLLATRIDRPLNSAFLYERGCNYKNEYISSFELLNQSVMGMYFFKELWPLLGYRPAQNDIEKEIVDKGYSIAHIWHFMDNPGSRGMEKNCPKPPEDFRAMVCLCLDRLRFYTESPLLNPLDEALRFKTYQSIPALLFSRLESVAFLYMELQKTPSISTHFRVRDLMTNPAYPGSTSEAIFYTHLTETRLGKQMLAFLFRHNPALQKEFTDLFQDESFISQRVMAVCSEKGVILCAQKVFEFCRYVYGLPVVNGASLLKEVFAILETSPAFPEILAHPVNGSCEKEALSLHRKHSFLTQTDSPQKLTLGEWFASFCGANSESITPKLTLSL